MLLPIAEERKRAEAAREKLQDERDQMLGELRKAESEARVLTVTTTDQSSHAQQHTARLLAEVTELRRCVARRSPLHSVC